MPPSSPTVRAAAPGPPAMAGPRRRLPLPLSRRADLPVCTPSKNFEMSCLVAAFTFRGPSSGLMCPSIRPLSVTMVDADFFRPRFPSTRPFSTAVRYSSHSVATVSPLRSALRVAEGSLPLSTSAKAILASLRASSGVSLLAAQFELPRSAVQIPVPGDPCARARWLHAQGKALQLAVTIKSIANDRLQSINEALRQLGQGSLHMS